MKIMRENQKGLFSFERMFSTKIIKVVYILSLIGILIAAILVFVSVSSGQDNFLGQHQNGNILLGLLEALGILIGGTLILRIVCEGLIVIFSINDKLADIKELLKK